MKARWFNIVVLFTLLAGVMPLAVQAAPPIEAGDNPTVKSKDQFELETVGTASPEETDEALTGKGKYQFEAAAATLINMDEAAVYIVQLKDASVASYRGGINGLSATNPAARGESKLDAEAPASVAYMDYLAQEQAQAIAEVNMTLGRSIDVLYTYKAALNGFAAEMTAAEAAIVAKLPSVKYIEREHEYTLDTDAGPAWMGASGLWDGSETGGLPGTYGEGIIIGVIDTGIDPWNPSFLDIGDDSYDHTNPWGAGTYVGVCDSTDPSYDPTFPCNDKLIGAWGYASVNGGDPRDADGHGSHTTSTAGGNFVHDATITTPSGVYTANISGVAPHANVVMYAACCTGAALTAAKEQVILDGVDVVNYSIGYPGGTADLWASVDTQAWLNVRDAGIFVATSAGNSGAAAGTMGGPGDAPWMLTVGASSHDRAFLNSIILDNGTTTTTLDGLSMTGPFGPALVVYSADYVIGTATADDARLCAPGAFPAGTFNGEIVVCERGTYGRVAKGQSVDDGGAGGYVLAQPTEFGGGPGALVSDPHVLPAVHIDYYAYQNLRSIVTGTTVVSGTIVGTTLDNDDAHGDIMAAFSSRGPIRSDLFIKPDVTAPGRSIWAAYQQGAAGDGDYTFNVIGGTSMSSPHAAGAAALLRALHPGWTPAQVQAAMMTTARNTVVDEDGTSLATPFEQGAGHVALGQAAQAGFVLDVTTQEFTDADPASGGDPSALNLASLADSSCIGTCSWTREISSTQSTSVNWSATTAVFTDGITLTVTPANFNLGAYATQIITVEADVSGRPNDIWTFGEVTLAATNVPTAHFPVAVKASTGLLPNPVEINTRRDAGSQLIKGLETIEVVTLTVDYYGLKPGTLTEESLSRDATNGDPYDNMNDGTVFFITEAVPAGAKRLVAEITASEAPDIDLFVGRDLDGDGPEESEEVCSSTTGSWTEYCDITGSDLVAGDWWILVQNWKASGDPPDAVTLATAVVAADNGNITVTGPSSVPAQTPYDLRFYWDEPLLDAGETWYGMLELSSTDLVTDSGDVGVIPVNLTRHDDDVTKTANSDWAFYGDTVTYTINVLPNITPEDLDYVLTDTIPAGLTYVNGSLSATGGSVSEAGGVIAWSGTMAVPEMGYAVSDNNTDPACDTGFGGYVNLEGLGIMPQSGLAGDGIGWTAFAGQNPFQFYGVDNTGMGGTDDGYGYFDTTVAWPTNTALPDPANPNDILAIFWNDMEIVYDGTPGSARGVSLATAGSEVTIMEYDDVEPAPAGSTTDRYDAEVVMLSTIDNTPGAYEIAFAYDNITGSPASATVGVEDVNGVRGTQYLYGNPMGVITDGLIICFDYTSFGDSITITYQATVDDPGVGSPVTNDVLHNTDNPGSQEAQTDFDLYIVGEAEKNISSTLIDPGELVTYTIKLDAGPTAATWNVTDAIPSGLDFVSVDGATFATDSIEWTGALGTGTLLVEEGFENAFPPTGWNLYQTGAADDPGWVQTSAKSHSGDNSVYHNDDDTTGDAIAWLVTPQIAVPASGGDFTFWQYDFHQTYYQYHGVWVTTDANPDPATASYTEVYSGDVASAWVLETLDLAAYAGQNIYVAFRYEGDWMDEWYIDDVSYPTVVSNPDSHTITLTLEGVVPGYYTNIANITTQGQSFSIATPELFVNGPIPTWEKEVWVNGVQHAWDASPFDVVGGDVVSIVDRVYIDFDAPITYTLVETWTDSLSLDNYVADFGTVTTGTNALSWNVNNGAFDTWYAITKTFDVSDAYGWHDLITETLTVEGWPEVQTRTVGFDIAAAIAKSGPSTASTGDLISYTIVIETSAGIQGAVAMTDTLPAGITYAGGLTTTGGTASYNAGDNAVYWTYSVTPVAWTQPATNTTSIYAAQDFETSSDAYDIFFADDFVIGDSAWSIDSIFVPGDTWNTGCDYTCADALNWEIYADAGGVPDGDPSGGGNSPVWSLSLSPTDSQVTLSAGGSGFLTDVAVALDTPAELPAGIWWLSFYPRLNFGTCGCQSGFHVASTTNGYEGHRINPGGGFGFPSNGWEAFDTSLAMGYHDAAFDLAGIVTPPPTVTITFDANVTAAPGASVTNIANLNYNGLLLSAETTFDLPLLAGVAIAPTTDALSGAPGETVTYTQQITNTGNYTDTFDLTTSGNSWATVTPPSVGPLAANASQAVQVAVTIPATAHDGDHDTVTLTATSQADGSKQASSTLTTSAVIGCVDITGADFNFTPSAPKVGQVVTFTGSIAAGTLPITYTWNFNDGSTGNGQTITHIFPLTTTAKTYTVTMTASNACPSEQAVDKIITVVSRYIYLPLVMRNSP